MFYLMFILIFVSIKPVLVFSKIFKPQTIDNHSYQTIFLPKPQVTKSFANSRYTVDPLEKNSRETCGTIQPKITHLIANSRYTLHEIWPWNVQLVIDVDIAAKTKVYCGGTIVSKNFILTAAHCFDELKPKQRPHNTLILFNSIFIDRQRNTFKLKAEDIIKHPAYLRNFDETKYFQENPLLYDSLNAGPKHDLALVKFSFEGLHERLKQIISAQLKRVCLPRPNVNLKEGTRCIILGQGLTNQLHQSYKISTQLQFADVIISTNERCRSNFESDHVKNKINADTLCINGDKHPCLGDSGGSLICNQRDKWFLMGITSFAVSSQTADTCGTFKSAVFAKISNYIDWIRNYASD
jgi:hypothetical protein